MAGASTRTLAIRGAGWTTLGVGFQRAVQTASILVLARILAPEDFGLVAIAVLVLTAANRVKTLGLHTSLVQHEGDVEAASDACFLINGALTLATIAVVVAVAPLVSHAFDPRAGSLLAVMSLRLVPQALAAVPTALAVRALDFRKVAAIQAAEALVSAIVAVVLAVAGWGAWSLVVGALAGSTAGSLLWWIRPVWIPSWRLDRGAAEQLIHTGMRVWSAANLALVIDGANRLFIGGFLGIARLGYYEILGRIVHAPLQTLVAIHDRVAISAFCRERQAPELIGRWFLRLSALMVSLTGMIAGTLLVFPDILIPTLFGPGWQAAIEPARALGLFALLAPLVSTAPVFIAARRTDWLLSFTTIRTVLTVAALFVAARVSLTAVCLAESLTAAVFAPINILLVARMTGLRARAVVSSLSVPTAGFFAFAATAGAIRGFVPALGSTPGPVALVGVFVPSAAVLTLTVLAMRPRLISEIRSIVNEAVGRS